MSHEEEPRQTQIEVLGKVKIRAWENTANDSLTTYTDSGMIVLNEKFDTATIIDPLRNPYTNFSSYRASDEHLPKEVLKSKRLWDLLIISKEARRFVGLNEADYNRFVDWHTGRDGNLNISPNDPPLPDVRIEEFEGQKVYFPTEKLLENFGVERRAAQFQPNPESSYIPEVGSTIYSAKLENAMMSDLNKILPNAAALALITGASIEVEIFGDKFTVRPRDAEKYWTAEELEIKIARLNSRIAVLERNYDEKKEEIRVLYQEVAFYQLLETRLSGLDLFEKP